MQVEMVGNAHNIHAFIAQVGLSYEDSYCCSVRGYKWVRLLFTFLLHEHTQDFPAPWKPTSS